MKGGPPSPLLLSKANIAYRYLGDGFVNDDNAALVGQPYMQLIESATDYFVITKYSFGHTISFRNSNQAVEYHGWDNTAGAWTTVLTIEPIPNGGGRIWVRNDGDSDGICLMYADHPIIKTEVADHIYFGATDALYLNLSTTELKLKATHVLCFSSDTVADVADVKLVREAANTLALKNGTTQQTLLVYGTTTGSKYLSLTHNGSLALVGTSAGDLYLGAAGTNSWIVQATTGHFFGAADNTYDIGATAANRPRSGYFATSLEIGGSPVSRTLNVNVAAVGNVGVGTDDLITYAIAANVFNANGKAVRINAWGTTANNANAKTVTFVVGSQTVLTTVLTTSIAGQWEIEVYIVRTGVDTQDIRARLLQGATVIFDQELTAGTQDDGASITVKCTGAATSNNDIVQEGMITELLN